MKDETTHTHKQCTSRYTFPGVLGVALLYLLLSTTVLAWASVAEAQLRRCLALLILSLLVSAAWLPPVGAQPTLVKDINLLPTSSSPGEFVAIGNVVYFAANYGVTGRELWRSDGTAAGTVLVKDIWPGSGNSIPFSSSLTNVNGVLYFRADNGVTGAELWRLAP